MKIKMLSWIYLIGSVLFGLAALYFLIFDTLLYGDTPVEMLRMGLISLILALACGVWGYGLKKHLSWAWFAGIILMPLGVLANGWVLASAFDLVKLGGLVFNLFVVFILVIERKLFFPKHKNHH